MTLRYLFLPLFLLLQAKPTPTPNPRFFLYQRLINRTSSTVSGQTCTPLDATVFAHASRDLSDLRLYNGVREIPYAIQLFTASNPAADTQPVILNLGMNNGHVVFDAQMLRQSYSTIAIETQAQNFIASVDVSGSQSANPRSSTRLGTFAIFDLTSQQLARSTVLHLSPSTFPYLHFSVNGPLKPSDITGITVLASSEHPPVYRTIVESHQVVQHGHLSTVTFRVPANVPVDRVEILPAIATGNFSRGISIEGIPPQNTWRASASGTILRVHTVRNGLHLDEEQYAVDAPSYTPPLDTGDLRWTVTIDNGDDAPLALQTVRLEMHERTLCFDATPGAAYTLDYGDSTLAAPHYDYATLFQPLDHPDQAVLAPEQPNPQFQPRPDTRPLTERYPGLLWAVLIVVVIVLGGIALRTTTQLTRA